MSIKESNRRTASPRPSALLTAAMWFAGVLLFRHREFEVQPGEPVPNA